MAYRPNLLGLDVHHTNDFGLWIQKAADLHLFTDKASWQILVVEMIDVTLDASTNFPPMCTMQNCEHEAGVFPASPDFDFSIS